MQVEGMGTIAGPPARAYISDVGIAEASTQNAAVMSEVDRDMFGSDRVVLEVRERERKQVV